MKKLSLILILFALILNACNSDKVKVRGKITDLKATVKLLAEMPGENGKVVLAEQEVTDGNINLSTDVLKIPARVWVEISGKNEPLEFIVDTKDMIWIEGKANLLNEKFGVQVKGSGLEKDYDQVRKLFKEKYEGPIEPIDRSIMKIMNKEKMTQNDEIMLGIYQIQKQRYVKYRANYAKTWVEANAGQELALFVMQDELKDSIDLQKKLFKGMKIENKESNVYKNLESKLQ